MKISELLDSIEARDLVLPEFQREYVWNRDQAKQLVDSLRREFPVGSLLFWKTDKPPELKNVDILPDKIGTVSVILDGQQRLTTLYLLLRGKVPAYYSDADISNDPRDLFFNVDTGDLQYYSQLRMKDNPLWVRVTEIFTGKPINVFEIAQKVSQTDTNAFLLAQRYTDSLSTLRSIEKSDLPTQTVPTHASLENAITIFDLVNSQGTKLTDAELALTHITGKWSVARRVMKSKQQELSKAHFYFDLTFMTRALTAVVCQRALFETIHSRPKPELESGWAKLREIIDYLITLLPGRAHVHSTRDLSTTNVLVPLVLYLSLNDTRFPRDTAIKRAIHWLYAAQIWGRYTAQTDQRLEEDLSIAVRESDPWEELCNKIIDQRGRLDVKAADLEGRGIQHPLFNIGFILAKAGGAMDWSNGAPLAVVPGKPYGLINAYVFPPALLYRNGYDSDNHMHRTIVNEIANRVVLRTVHPYEDKRPDEYLPLVEQAYPGALGRQFIPMDPNLWQLGRFEDFLAARREIITRKINEFMHALVSEPVIVHKRSLAELINLGESATLEFKSTLQWDIIQGKQNTGLRHEVLKTIAAFLNSGGGTLVIGVEDDGKVFGLERDLAFVKGKNADGFQQTLSSIIADQLGAGYSPYIKVRFESLNGHQLCVIDVERSSEPAYLKGQHGQELWVRLASTSRRLDAEEAVRHVQANW